MTITLIGHGYIGSQIADYFEYHNLRFHHMHHQDKIPLETDLVVNAAGFTGYQNVDDCEREVENTFMSNVAWPVKLSALPIPIIHLSTGCIFNDPNKIFNEEDKPNFGGNVYALSRKVMEEVLSPFMKKDYMLRIRLPFDGSLSPKNLLSKLHKYPTLYNMKLGSMSYVPDVVKTVYHIATQQPRPGFYNVVNPGEVHMEDIVQLMGWSKPVSGIQPASRCYCRLTSNKISLGSVKDALRTSCQTWKQNYAAVGKLL